MSQLPSITAADVAAAAPAIAVLPVGSYEQHGDHLPLATDAIIAATIADRLAGAYNLLRLPPVSIACSHEHENLPGLPGTVSISATTLAVVIGDIRASLRRSGIDRLILVNAHGGNYGLRNVVQEANIEGTVMGLYPRHGDWVTARTAAGMETSHDADMHAGELETSIMFYEHPDLVGPTYRDNDFHCSDRPDLLERGMAAYTTSGVIGKPSAATAEKGRLALDNLTADFEGYLRLF